MIVFWLHWHPGAKKGDKEPMEAEGANGAKNDHLKPKTIIWNHEKEHLGRFPLTHTKSKNVHVNQPISNPESNFSIASDMEISGSEASNGDSSIKGSSDVIDSSELCSDVL